MSVKFFLVDGTQQELLDIAKEKQIDPETICLVNRLEDIQGFREGEIIFGRTGIFDIDQLSRILQYAYTHGIKVP